jgi:hypothetical protein
MAGQRLDNYRFQSPFALHGLMESAHLLPDHNLPTKQHAFDRRTVDPCAPRIDYHVTRRGGFPAEGQTPSASGSRRAPSDAHWTCRQEVGEAPVRRRKLRLNWDSDW